MSRTQPTILLEMVDKVTYKCDQIVEAAGIWAVFYDDQPINLKSQHYQDPDATPKYKKTSFSNPGHARNLCRKLNAQFKALLIQMPKVVVFSKLPLKSCVI